MFVLSSGRIETKVMLPALRTGMSSRTGGGGIRVPLHTESLIYTVSASNVPRKSHTICGDFQKQYQIYANSFQGMF